ncbi:EAL domain-containing protein [Marinospirillum alkaliphilum]|uniref:cyclic-guanylate-specific phosphodiesterase n=1 Tax=Marinospirillum alkaliphilum DSM 21637 TaxID=1122209 RepID=A0A1K1Z6V3_9GAMM|nr:EAL domain-containing protein [Marinospirillum alkaliphilum]SFX69815.1 diguanylate cyclase (GGDEF) domain-containing protein [Marinospirillum alkaliphilum DSM 21637]
MPVISPSRLLKLLVVGMLGGVLLMTLGLLTYETLQTHQRVLVQQTQTQQEQLDDLRQQLDQEVTGLHDYLRYHQSQAESLLRDMAREQVDVAWETAMGIYRTAKGRLPDARIQELIVESLREVRFFQGRGYLFIDTLDGDCILLPTAPHLEGSSLWDNRDDTGFYIMRGLVDAVSNPQGRGFIRYRWYRPDQPQVMADKLAFARLFEPYDWLIGTGDYLYQIETDLKQTALERIEGLRLPAEGYIAVLDEAGRLLTSTSSPQDVGRLPEELDDLDQQQLVLSFIDKARNGGGFIEYNWYRPDHEGRHAKLARVQWVPETGWILVAGAYLDALEPVSTSPVGWWQALRQELPRLMLPLVVVGLITLLVALLYARWLGRLLAGYQQHIQQQQSRLQQLAELDNLTHLANRWLLGQKLMAAMDRAMANEMRLGLLVIDVDRFKNINDSLGHTLGDRVLQILALRLNSLLEENQLLARMGGDEFVLLVEGVQDNAQLLELAQRVLETIHQPVQIEYHQLVVTASIGIALYPDHGLNQETLFRHADTAMYQAKSEGRNRFCLYVRSLGQRVVDRLQLENDLRQALRLEQQLFLVYQPQWDLHSGQLIGCEVLLRWQHPRRGLISPAEFIPLAEETGLILPLGSWVLRTALAQARAWREQGLPSFTLAVNLSTAQLTADLPRQISALLRGYELPASLLELEVTETLLMTAPEEATQLLGELKKTGVRIALDDFGTGYSSLAYLSRLPLDVLKIDKSFVDGLPDRQDDVVITRLIIRMAAQLGITTLAEGVETEAQQQFLKAAGCHLMQGYLKAKPLQQQEMAALLLALKSDLS